MPAILDFGVFSNYGSGSVRDMKFTEDWQMQFFFKTLMLSMIISLPQISFANSRSDAAVNFLSGLLGVAKALEEQRSQNNEQPQPHSMPRGEQSQTYSTQDNTTSQGVLGSYRYEMDTKEGFLKGINDGRVWQLLTGDRRKVCIVKDCYNNIYTKDSPSGLQDNLDRHYSTVAGHVIATLESNYGLTENDRMERMLGGYQYHNFIGAQLTIVALLNSSVYAKNDRLVMLLDENLRNFYRENNNNAGKNFSDAFGRFLRDYDNAWKVQAPIALSNSYYMKQGICKESNSYKLYNAALSTKQMDSTVEINDLTLKMIAAQGGRDQDNVAGNRNLAASMRVYYFNEYKKLGGRATSVASIEVPPNPCK